MNSITVPLQDEVDEPPELVDDSDDENGHTEPFRKLTRRRNKPPQQLYYHQSLL